MWYYFGPNVKFKIQNDKNILLTLLICLVIYLYRPIWKYKMMKSFVNCIGTRYNM